MQKVKRFRFVAEGLACDVFAPGTGELSLSDRPGAMYLYGFPGSIGENEVTRKMLEAGFVVFQPHYPGTYDSSGEFTPQSAIDMLAFLGEVITKGQVENVKNLRVTAVPRTVRILIGHSFGAFVSLRGARYLDGLELLMLLGPAVAYASDASGCGLSEDGEEHIAYVRRSRPHTYRLGVDDDWLDVYAGKFDLGSEPFAHPTLRAIRGRVGKEDSYFNHSQLLQRFEPIVHSHLRGRDLRGGELIEIKEVDGAGHGPAGLLTADDLALT